LPDACTHNHWLENRCAKAFWGQQELPSFQRLLADTLAWANPQAGERWLDLGCGGGALTRGIWERTQGQVSTVVGVDCANINADAYERLRVRCQATEEQLQFICHNFSAGLGLFADDSFDHAVSGLSISYAEAWDAVSRTWNQTAYDRVLGEVWRVLRPGGRFVFSVNVPEPSWKTVALHSLRGLVHSSRPLHFLKKAWRMLRYGAWLKQQARCGRFHYLPSDTVAAKLYQVGYRTIRHGLSYSGQAYIFQAVKPTVPVEAGTCEAGRFHCPQAVDSSAI
jgi:ubiquinone/menaquinone biosynthesis C-methylase UbiE